MPSLRLVVTFRDHLPLAMYRELIAHLQQLAELEVIPKYREFKEFDYLASPIEQLHLIWQGEQGQAQLQLLLNILGHYGQFTIVSPGN